MPTDERNQMDQPFLLPRLLSVDGRVVWHSITGPAFFDYRPFFVFLFTWFLFTRNFAHV